MIAVLTATGHITDERRQEFILWSDALGLSMLVDALAHELPAGRHRVDRARSVLRARGRRGANTARAWSSEERRRGPGLGLRPGARRVGAPIAGAELDVWQNGADMLYAVQRPEAEEDHLRGRYLTREDGTYAFVARTPGAVSDPARRTRRPDARGHRPPSVAPGAHPHHRARAGLQDRDHARVRRHQPVPRLRHRVRGQAVAPADVRRALARRSRAPGRRHRRVGLARERHRAGARATTVAPSSTPAAPADRAPGGPLLGG